MSRFARAARLTAVALALTACSEAGPTDPLLDVSEDQPLAAVLPDLAPDAGTAGTDRYAPTLLRVFHRAVGVVKERRGEEEAQKLVAQARSLHAEMAAAREAGDAEAARAAHRRLEAFSAQVGLRVFGPRLVGHVAGDATGKLKGVGERLRAAHDAGRDVTRLVEAFQAARRHLEAAREGREADRPVAALVHAATALDLAHRLTAALD